MSGVGALTGSGLAGLVTVVVAAAIGGAWLFVSSRHRRPGEPRR